MLLLGYVGVAATILLLRRSFHHGERAGVVTLDDVLVANLVRCGYRRLLWYVYDGLSHEGDLLLVIARTQLVRATPDGRLGAPVVGDEHVLIAWRDCLLLRMTTLLDRVLVRADLLLIEEDAGLDLVDGAGEHVGHSLLQSASLSHLLLLLLLVERAGSRSDGCRTGRDESVLGALGVHLVVMHVHLEDLLDLEVVLRPALRRCRRFVDRVAVLLD